MLYSVEIIMLAPPIGLSWRAGCQQYISFDDWSCARVRFSDFWRISVACTNRSLLIVIADQYVLVWQGETFWELLNFEHTFHVGRVLSHHKCSNQLVSLLIQTNVFAYLSGVFCLPAVTFTRSLFLRIISKPCLYD